MWFPKKRICGFLSPDSRDTGTGLFNLTEQECIEELEKFGKYKEFYYVDGVLLDKRRAIECIRRKYYAYEFDFKLCVKFNPKDVVWFCREKRNR